MAQRSKLKVKKDKAAPAEVSRPRARRLPGLSSFRRSRRIKPTKNLPGVIKLTSQSFRIIKNNLRPFGLIILVSFLASLIFSQGLGSSFDIAEIKRNIEEFIGQDSSKFATAAALFGYMISSSGASGGEIGGVYQLFLTIVISLASIWLIRQLLTGKKPSGKDAFYKGMYPLIPFILILFVIGLQLIPLLVGNVLFSTVIQNSLAVTFFEKFAWFLVFILLGLASLYMLASSLFALYIVTLPEMTPLKALRSARELVVRRRFSLILRIVALPIIIVFLAAVILIPLLIIAAPLAQIIFIFMTSFALVLFHVYMYILYRELL